MFLGMLEEGLICDVLSPLLWSDPLFDFKMFGCMKEQLCPMYHFLSFILVLASLDCILDILVELVSWLMFSLSDVTLHLINVVPVRLDTSRVSVIALKTSLGFFLFSFCLEIGRLFHHLKPSLPRKPMIVAYHLSLSMLDASRARMTWPFHSSNASCWSSPCQSNLGGCYMSCPEAIVLQIDWMQGSWKELQNACFEDELGQNDLTRVQIWPRCVEGLSLTRYAVWLILAQIDVQWSKCEMVLKEVTVASFYDNFTNIRNTGLKFWHNMGTYSGHLWSDFQQAAVSIVEVTLFLCVFEMVLKEANEYTFCNNFINTRDTELKFWYNVSTYYGHIWCGFQQAAASIVEVTTLFVCFWHGQICS